MSILPLESSCTILMTDVVGCGSPLAESNGCLAQFLKFEAHKTTIKVCSRLHPAQQVQIHKKCTKGPF
jgi:hypothetical protein